MVTYVQTTYNQLETPSGAVGEAPDGPGAFKHLSDQIDGRLGVGGAEYCANAAAMSAIPSSRLFKGKRVYRADLDIVFRYVGAGNTALGTNDSTSKWQAWSKPAAAFTPAWSAGLTLGSSTQVALWGISAGMIWCSIVLTAGTGFATVSGADAVLTAPSPFVGYMGAGGGQYQRGGNNANGYQVDLAVYGIGAAGQSSTSIRVRAKYATAAPGPVTANQLGSVIASTTSDMLEVSFTAPSALVA